MHVRRQIREAVATALTGLATTAGRVFQSSVYPREDADLPALLIFSENETSTPMTINSPRVSQRILRLQVVAVAKAISGLDDALDQICEEVEKALANPVAAILPLARTITLTQTEFRLAGTAEKPVGTATMSFEADYSTAEDAPDVAL